MMTDYIDRLYTERDELAVKIEKLQTFLNSEAFKGLSREDRGLLAIQKSTMDVYITILNKRINKTKG